MKRMVVMLTGFFLLSGAAVAFGSASSPGTRTGDGAGASIWFATYAEYPPQVPRCMVFCQSIRDMAGSMSDAPIRLYISERLDQPRKEYQDRFDALDVEVVPFRVPEEAAAFVLAGKPSAAARAEADAAGRTDVLAFLDANVVVLSEPRAFRLAAGKALAYRPVMHQNVGSLYSEPPDAFWTRIYGVLGVPESAVFPMEGIADKKTIRPYFNAGYLVVRPERGVLRKWADSFRACVVDPELEEKCREDRYNVFLHQAALAGAVLVHIGRDEMVELPWAYNYPLFFDRFYDSEVEFDSLEGVVSIKYEFDFKDLPDGWDQTLGGPAEAVSWIKSHCSGVEGF